MLVATYPPATPSSYPFQYSPKGRPDTLYNTSIPRWEAYTFHHHHHLHLPNFSHTNVSLFCFLSKGGKGSGTRMHFSPACFCFCIVLCLYVCSALHWRRRRTPLFFLLWSGCITQATRAVLDGAKRQRIQLSVGLGLYLVVPRIRVRVKVLICSRAVLWCM
jgi:hypothetical protein